MSTKFCLLCVNDRDINFLFLITSIYYLTKTMVMEKFKKHLRQTCRGTNKSHTQTLLHSPQGLQHTNLLLKKQLLVSIYMTWEVISHDSAQNFYFYFFNFKVEIYNETSHPQYTKQNCIFHSSFEETLLIPINVNLPPSSATEHALRFSLPFSDLSLQK